MLELVRELTDRCGGSSPPSQVDIENGLQSGLARLIALEGRLRSKRSCPTQTQARENAWENHELAEEIRALREAVTRLRVCASSGQATPLAEGFVAPRSQ